MASASTPTSALISPSDSYAMSAACTPSSACTHRSLCAVLCVLLVSFLMAGCGTSPEDLAEEMCDCVADDGATACVSLSQEHMNTLGDDREALVAYRQAVAQCRR